jgi:hypothetical protein
MADIRENTLRKTRIASDLKKTFIAVSLLPVSKSNAGACSS